MSAPFLVFYRYQGADYNAPFSTMRKAKQFARLTGGRVELRLTNLLDRAKLDHIRVCPNMNSLLDH